MGNSATQKSKWAAYLGGLSVILSLLLVAWEIRENTLALSAQAMQELNNMANETLLIGAENERLAEILVKGDSDLSSLSEVEYRQYWYYHYGLINTLDAAHGFYARGILDEADYSGWRVYTCEYLAEPSVRSIWKKEKDTFGVSFTGFVERECGL
jgi:uncharacterized protein YcfL